MKKGAGRPPRIKDIKKAQELRKKGLSFAQISYAVLKREDKKTIYRWCKIDVGKKYPEELSTV